MPKMFYLDSSASVVETNGDFPGSRLAFGTFDPEDDALCMLVIERESARNVQFVIGQIERKWPESSKSNFKIRQLEVLATHGDYLTTDPAYFSRLWDKIDNSEIA